MITSPDNDRVRFLRSLYAKKKRYDERAFVVEGVRLLEEALDMGRTPRLVLFQPETLARTVRGASLLGRLDREALPASERVLKSVSDTVAPQGIVAAFPFAEEPAMLEGTLALLLDGIRDPGNLGTILRTAAAAAIKSIVTTVDTVDPFSPKVVRAGMGAHFRLDLFVDKGWTEIDRLVAGRRLLLAAAGVGKPYYDVNWREPSTLILGGEATGASANARQLATETVTIPMARGVDSLNAAVAAGVLAFEAFKQNAQSGNAENTRQSVRP